MVYRVQFNGQVHDLSTRVDSDGLKTAKKATPPPAPTPVAWRSLGNWAWLAQVYGEAATFGGEQLVPRRHIALVVEGISTEDRRFRHGPETGVTL